MLSLNKPYNNYSKNKTYYIPVLIFWVEQISKESYKHHCTKTIWNFLRYMLLTQGVKLINTNYVFSLHKKG